MYRVELSLEAEQFYAAANRPLAKKLARCFERLEENPRNHPNIKPLKGNFAGYYRYRVGDYRVDVQELFTSRQFAGQYKTEYKDYKNFFTMVTEIEHQSTLILIGQEQCQEMLCLDEELYPVKCLELENLDNTEILKSLGLKDEESWLTLLNLYEGNPAYLKDVASLIKNIFLGKVSEFLTENSLILTENMKSRFNELFERLSASEQQIVLELSKYNQAVSREDLRPALSLSSMDLINGLQSLQKRYLIKTIEGDKVKFNLSPVFRAYVRTCCQDL